MKKLLSLALILCLCFLSLSSAEQAYEISDGSPLHLEDFILTPEPGMAYTMGAKVASTVMLMVYPNAASGDMGTNYNFVWLGGAVELTPADVDSLQDMLREQITAGYAANGISVNSMEFTGAVECEIAGETCVMLDITSELVTNSITVPTYQRLFYCGARGYSFTLSSVGKDALDQMTEQLSSALTWN